MKVKSILVIRTEGESDILHIETDLSPPFPAVDDRCFFDLLLPCRYAKIYIERNFPDVPFTIQIVKD